MSDKKISDTPQFKNDDYMPKISGDRLATNGYQPRNDLMMEGYSPKVATVRTSQSEPVKHGYQPPSQTRPVAPPPKKP